MSNHTNGKWDFIPGKITGRIVVDQPVGVIAHVYAKGDSVWDDSQNLTGYANVEEFMANGYLMAAAPDLLLALRSLLCEYGKLNPSAVFDADCIVKAHQAVEKAIGKS